MSGESRDVSTPCWICQPQNSSSNFTYGKSSHLLLSYCLWKRSKVLINSFIAVMLKDAIVGIDSDAVMFDLLGNVPSSAVQQSGTLSQVNFK